MNTNFYKLKQPLKTVSFQLFLFCLICGVVYSCGTTCDTCLTENGKVTVSGKIPDSSSSVNTVSISYIASNFRNELLSEIVDTSGFFRFDVTVQHSQVIYLRSFAGIIPVYISPGDSILINLNMDLFKNGVKLPFDISGNNPKTSINTKDFFQFYDPNTFKPVTVGKSVDQYLKDLKNNIHKEDSILTVFIDSHKPTKQFIGWARQEIIYRNANFIEDFKFYHFANNTKFSGNLYNSEYFPVNNNPALTSISYYTYLWNYCMGKYVEKDSSILNYFNRGEFYKAYSYCFENIVQNESQSLSRDLMIYALTLDALNRSRDEFFKLGSIAPTYIKNSSLKEKLNERKQQIEKQPDFSISQIINATGQEKEIIGQFFPNLISTHQNKVLYIDIWATWCGPCRKEFSFTPMLHEYFKDKPVSFINLCLSSDWSEWIKSLNDLKIGGENYYFNKAQSQILKNKLRFSGFPSYLIVDQNGQIITTSAPRPSDDKNLIKILDDLITK